MKDDKIIGTEQIKESIQKYLDDENYYRIKSNEIIIKRKYRNFYCQGLNGKIVPIKEIGDLFGLFDGLTDDHSHRLLPILLEMGIPVYAKRRYESLNNLNWAIEKNLLIILDNDSVKA